MAVSEVEAPHEPDDPMLFLEDGATLLLIEAVVGSRGRRLGFVSLREGAIDTARTLSSPLLRLNTAPPPILSKMTWGGLSVDAEPLH